MLEADTQGYGAKNSQHLSDENILAALDGMADQNIRSHLAHCPCCMARADDLVCFERQLRHCLYRALCPSADELLVYVQRKLNPEDFIRITEHIFDCQECTHELHILESATNIPTHIELLDMQPRQDIGEQNLIGLRHKARLSLGLSDTNHEVQYVYHTNNMSLTLSISKGLSNKEPSLSGFLIMKPNQDQSLCKGWVSLIHDGQVLHKGYIDTSGFFQMQDLALGRHILSLQTEQYEIVIDPLDI